MGLPWPNSASEKFVNLNKNHLVNCFEFLYTDFVQGLLYLGILCCQVFAVAFIQSYGLGGECYMLLSKTLDPYKKTNTTDIINILLYVHLN